MIPAYKSKRGSEWLALDVSVPKTDGKYLDLVSVSTGTPGSSIRLG